MRPPRKVTPKPTFDDLPECTLQGSIGAAMNDNAQDIGHRIKELEGAVRKARIEAMRLACDRPSNARRPVSLSYSTQPNAQISVRSAAASPSICSGAMY